MTIKCCVRKLVLHPTAFLVPMLVFTVSIMHTGVMASCLIYQRFTATDLCCCATWYVLCEHPVLHSSWLTGRAGTKSLCSNAVRLVCCLQMTQLGRTCYSDCSALPQHSPFWRCSKVVMNISRTILALFGTLKCPHLDTIRSLDKSKPWCSPSHQKNNTLASLVPKHTHKHTHIRTPTLFRPFLVQSGLMGSC